MMTIETARALAQPDSFESRREDVRRAWREFLDVCAESLGLGRVIEALAAVAPVLFNGRTVPAIRVYPPPSAPATPRATSTRPIATGAGSSRGAS